MGMVVFTFDLTGSGRIAAHFNRMQVQTFSQSEAAQLAIHFRRAAQHIEDNLSFFQSAWERTDTSEQCESILGGGRCILKNGHRGDHEFS